MSRRKIEWLHTDSKAGDRRQEHLSGVYHFQLQGKTARHTAQTEKSEVCVVIYPVTIFRTPMKPPTSSEF